jgi:hypothetical protein
VILHQREKKGLRTPKASGGLNPFWGSRDNHKGVLGLHCSSTYEIKNENPDCSIQIRDISVLICFCSFVVQQEMAYN